MWTHLPLQSEYESERRAWLARTYAEARKDYSELRLSSHSLLLLLDMERAFCGGAWLSVIVVAQSVVEATLRQIVAQDYSTPIAQLSGRSRNLHWLRELRNEVTHAGQPGNPSKLWKLSPDNLPDCQAALEADARRAVSIAYKIMYVSAIDWGDE